MSYRTMTSGRAVRRRVVPAVLSALAAGLGSLVPAQQAALAGALDASSIAAGGNHSCAIESGKAYCWGDNYRGDLGNGSTAGSAAATPVDASGVLAGKTLTKITAGDSHTCALDSGGAAYCWGQNDNGQLGDGSTAAFSSVPVAVDAGGVLAGKALTQLTAAGEFHTCALDRSGSAYCWGLNNAGQLGDGSANGSIVPVAVDRGGVLAGKALTQIAAGGGFHTCAVDASGAAYCWGFNDLGQLGSGSTADSSVPVAVDRGGALAGQTLTRITGGYFHTCALDAMGAAYCWGDSSLGQLGDNSLGASDVPVVVGRDAPTGVTAVTGDDAATVSWRSPANLNGGTLTGYTATASPGGETCSTVGATTCTITGLAHGTTYRITVVAHTTNGDSGASTPATVTVTHGPSGPIVSGLRATKCIDDSGDASANGTKLVIGDCNGGAEQTWTIEGNETIQINHKCMYIFRERKSNKALVELYTCSGGANQQWQAVNGTLMKPVSGKCLDDPRFTVTDGTQLEIYTCNGGANQQWKLP